MMNVWESLFGPGVGLIGFAVMVVMIVPKFIVRWRGFRARRRGAEIHVAENQLEDRELTWPDKITSLEPHARFGEACAELRTKSRYVFVCALLWILPLLLNLLIPITWSMRTPAFICTVPFACLGLWKMRHVFDHTVFYRTGFVQHLGFRYREIDYNAVVGYRKRASFFAEHPPTYIFLIEDESPAIFDGNTYVDGGKMIDGVLRGLAPRQIKKRIQVPKNADT